jgi:hypothetical protein
MRVVGLVVVGGLVILQPVVLLHHGSLVQKTRLSDLGLSGEIVHRPAGPACCKPARVDCAWFVGRTWAANLHHLAADSIRVIPRSFNLRGP